MTTYLVEVYEPRVADGAAALAERARKAARVTRGVRHIRSILVPEDETCFHVFEAQSRRAVVEAARRASMSAVRIVEAEPT